MTLRLITPRSAVWATGMLFDGNVYTKFLSPLWLETWKELFLAYFSRYVRKANSHPEASLISWHTRKSCSYTFFANASNADIYVGLPSLGCMKTFYFKCAIRFYSVWQKAVLVLNQCGSDITLCRCESDVCVCVCRFGGEGSTDWDFPTAGGGVVWFGRLLVPVCRLELCRNNQEPQGARPHRMWV